MGCLWIIVASMLSLVVIGLLAWLAWAVWLIVRMIKGWNALSAKQPIPNPTTWMA